MLMQKRMSKKKPYILVINNETHATKIEEQDKSLLCPSQARYHGSIVDDSFYVHDEKKDCIPRKLASHSSPM